MVERLLPAFGGERITPKSYLRGALVVDREIGQPQIVEFAALLPVGSSGLVWATIWLQGPLMRHERRTMNVSVAAELPVSLSAGEVVVLDLGQVELGFPELICDVTHDAVLDIGWSNLLPADLGIRWLGVEMMPYADRIRLPVGTQCWEPVLKRSFRFADLVCRRGQLHLKRLSLTRWYCPTAAPAAFSCSDQLLTRMHSHLVHGVRLLMQERWQDCLRREESTVNTQSFAYALIGALLALGASDVTRHTLRTIMRTQERSGWFDSHGLSGNNQDEVTECLLLHCWVRDWWQQTGDDLLICELLPQLGEQLEYQLRSAGRDGKIDQRLRHTVRNGEITYLADELSGLAEYAPPYGWRQPPPGVIPVILLGSNLLLAAAAAEALAELAPVAGLERRVPRYQAIAHRVRAALHQRCWLDAHGRYAGGVDGSGQPADRHPLLDLYALRFGLVPLENQGQILDLVSHELSADKAAGRDWPCVVHASNHHLFEVLFNHGRHREALDLIRVLWGSWYDIGGTGVPEGGRPFERSEGIMHDDVEVHAYGLGPLPLFHTRLLGVQPAKGIAAYASLHVPAISPGPKVIRIRHKEWSTFAGQATQEFSPAPSPP